MTRRVTRTLPVRYPCVTRRDPSFPRGKRALRLASGSLASKEGQTSQATVTKLARECRARRGFFPAAIRGGRRDGLRIGQPSTGHRKGRRGGIWGARFGSRQNRR